MNKNIKTIALCAALGLISTGCQKEDYVESSMTIVDAQCQRIIGYTIDGSQFQVEIRGEQAWLDFLEQMQVLAKEGHEVFFWNEETTGQSSVSKETLTFTTTSEKEATEWCEDKFDHGYKVGMTYDSKKGVYICVAIK